MAKEMRVLAGSDSGLFELKSSNGGESWESPRQLMSDVEISTIAQAPDGAVYVGTRYKGLFRGKGDLSSWEQIETPAELQHTRALHIDGDRFLAGNEANPAPLAIFEWDGRKNWQSLGDMSACSGSAEWFYPRQPEEGVHIRHLTVDPHKPERIYTALQVGGVGISPDGGKTWYDRRNLDLDVHMVEASPSEAGVVYAGSGGGGLFKSTDYGDTWTCVSEELGEFVVQFAVDPTNTKRVYLGTARGGPREWRNSPEVGAKGEMFRSDDGGGTWKRLSGGLPDLMQGRVNTIMIDPEEPNNVFFTGGHAKQAPGSGVMFSPDAGETWRPVAPLDEVIAIHKLV
jgi:photosystem II stability/assembly factor-like uncharacterized protein